MTHPTKLIGSVFAILLQETCMHLCIKRIYSQIKALTVMAILYIFEIMHVSFSKIIFNRKTIEVIYSTKLY